MAVNVIAGKNIESAIAANEAMVADSANFKQSEVMPERETKETLMADLKEGNTGKLGLRVLRQLVQGLSSAGIDLAKDKMVKKAGNKVKDEYDLMLERGEEGGDKIDIKDSRYFVQQTKAKNQDRQGGGSGDQSQQNLSPEAKEAVKQYVETYSSFLANGSADLKKKVETLEAKLSEKGLSAKDLLSLQANVRKSLRSEVLTQVKDSYINRLFVNKEKSLEFVMADRGIDEALSYAASNQRLGGEDFGGYRAGLEEALKES